MRICIEQYCVKLTLSFINTVCLSPIAIWSQLGSTAEQVYLFTVSSLPGNSAFTLFNQVDFHSYLIITRLVSSFFNKNLHARRLVCVFGVWVGVCNEKVKDIIQMVLSDNFACDISYKLII